MHPFVAKHCNTYTLQHIQTIMCQTLQHIHTIKLRNILREKYFSSHVWVLHWMKSLYSVHLNKDFIQWLSHVPLMPSNSNGSPAFEWVMSLQNHFIQCIFHECCSEFPVSAAVKHVFISPTSNSVQQLVAVSSFYIVNSVVSWLLRDVFFQTRNVVESPGNNSLRYLSPNAPACCDGRG